MTPTAAPSDALPRVRYRNECKRGALLWRDGLGQVSKVHSAATRRREGRCGSGVPSPAPITLVSPGKKTPDEPQPRAFRQTPDPCSSRRSRTHSLRTRAVGETATSGGARAAQCDGVPEQGKDIG